MSKPTTPVSPAPSMNLRAMQETIAAKSDEVAAMKAHARSLALEEVNRLVGEFGIEKGEISFAKPKGVEFTDGRAVVQAKFIDPATGTTWSGRGYRPVWLRAYMDLGRSIEEFRIGAEQRPDPEPLPEDAESSAPSSGM